MIMTEQEMDEQLEYYEEMAKTENACCDEKENITEELVANLRREIQILRSNEVMLQDTIVRLAMKLVGVY